MKRNWAVIVAIVVLIFAYQRMVLQPYQEKLAPVEVTSPAVDSNGKEIPPPTKSGDKAELESRIKITDTQKKASERVDVTDSRNFSIYSDGSIGNVVFNRYFQRGHVTKENVRLVENGFHWRSSDTRVDGCLRSLTKINALTFEGKSGEVGCRVKYSVNKLLISTSVEISSPTAVSGDVFFETEDTVGEGPEFDHRYLGLKKKDEKVDKIRGKKLFSDNLRSSGPYDWASWGDKYFSAILIPTGRFNPDVFRQGGFAEQSVHWGLAYPLRWSAEESKVSYNFDIYFALKDLKELQSVREDLRETIDFGFFAPIARFMLWALEMLYSVLHNYGLAIIILSLAIRLMLWPINRKMFESGPKDERYPAADGSNQEKVRRKERPAPDDESGNSGAL